MRGYLFRMRGYLEEMYPLPHRIALALLLALALGTLLARMAGRAPTPVSRFTLTAALSTFLLLLMLRLMDELKDLDLDSTLFPTRPLPSGRVRGSDIRLTLIVCAVLYVPLHGPHLVPLLSAAGVLGYAYLMFGWFFAPRYLRSRLIPTLVTHNPIVGLLFAHLALLFAAEFGLEARLFPWPGVVVTVVFFWAPAFAWEVSRKIRSSDEETAYVTYSRLLGMRGAVALAMGAQAAALFASLFLFALYDLSPALVAVVASGFVWALVGHLRFLRAPSPRTSGLARYAEGYLLATLVGGCLA